MAHPRALGTSTSRQLHHTAPSLVVPVGSTEQHGPHLPLDTDTRIAAAVGEALAERMEWLITPAIAYGASGEHEGFPGTVSIGTTVLTEVLVEFGRSAFAWASRLVFVNGHGGNVTALRRAVALLRREARDVAWCSCSAGNLSSGADAHAGHTETSVLLHLAPEWVRQDELVSGNTAPLSELMPSLLRGGVAAVSSLGILGDPTTATAQDGGEIFADMVQTCVERVVRWSPDREGMLT